MVDDWGAARAVRDLLLPVLLPSSTLLALLYYYGLVRSATFYGRFAVPVDILGFDTPDLVGQSLDVFIHPLRIAFIFFAVALVGYRTVAEWAKQPLVKAGPWPDRVLLGLGLLGVIFTDRIYFLGSKTGLNPLTASLIWTASIAVIWFALAGISMRDSRQAQALRPLARSRLSLPIFGTLLILGLFLSTAYYARQVGNRSADILLQHAGDNPDVVVVSPINLGRDDLILTEEVRNGDQVLYRYSDLKMLDATHDVYLLYPATQRPDDGVLILRNSDAFSIWIER